jgi:uncharacterized protein YuzE
MNNLLNIEMIIKLVEQQEPDRQDLIIALRNCKNGKWTSNGYYQFVDSNNANQIGYKWQFDENVVLEQENKGDIVLDILKDGSIGGIEFIDQIEQ